MGVHMNQAHTHKYGVPCNPKNKLPIFFMGYAQ